MANRRRATRLTLSQNAQLDTAQKQHKVTGQPDWTVSQSVMLYAAQEASVDNMLHWPRPFCTLMKGFHGVQINTKCVHSILPLYLTEGFSWRPNKH